MAPTFIASILKDFWVHSLILPFPSTDKQWLSPLCMSPGAGCHVGKADTPSLGSLQVTVAASVALPTCQFREPGSAPARGIAQASHLRGRKGRGEARGRPLMEPALLFRRHGSVQRRRLLDQGPHLGRHHQKRGVQNQCSGGGASSARAPAHHR